MSEAVQPSPQTGVDGDSRSAGYHARVQELEDSGLLGKYKDWRLGQYFLVGLPKLEDIDSIWQIEFISVKETDAPREYLDFLIDVEKTQTTLNSLFSKKARERIVPWPRPKPSECAPAPHGGSQRLRANDPFKYNEYMRDLAGIAMSALGDDRLVVGKLALKSFQDSVVERESAIVKNDYLKELGTYALLLSALSALILMVLTPVISILGQSLEKFGSFYVLITGAFLGTWLSFSIRKINLDFWDLSRLEEDRLEPPLRLLFVAGLTVIIGLLLSERAVEIKIGSFDSNFVGSAAKAFLIGCLCGVSEIGLSQSVSRRASEFSGAIGGARPERPS